jgi:prepilin-type N-terminal cleavage/methylation domain-containing protein
MKKELEHIKKLGARGVTLFEMLIVMALLSIFLVLLTSVFSVSLDSQTQTQAFSAVATDGRYLVARLEYDIQRASAVTTPASLGGSGSTLVLTISGSSYTYALSSGTLQLTDPTGTANLTGNRATVSGLSFQRIGNASGKDTVRYSFTLTSTAQTHAGATSQAFTGTAELR